MSHDEKHPFILPNGQLIRRIGSAYKTLYEADRFYIIIDTSPPDTITDNVFCFASEGTKLWRIEDVLPGRANSFADGRIRTNGILEFYNTDGWWVSIDRESGRGIDIRPDRMGPSPELPGDQFQPLIRPRPV